MQLENELLIQVPFRRVHLQDSNGHVDLYDTSGEQVIFLHAHVSPFLQTFAKGQILKF